MQFANHTVIISGGLGDIGRATALAFAREGASIALGDIKSLQEGDLVLNEIKDLNVQGHYQQVDVADANAVREWVAEVEDRLGVPNIIIANAATATIADIHSLTPQQWSRELSVNLDGAFYLTQFATSRLRDLSSPGRVIFVGSWAAHAVHAHLPAYSVSKAGLRMLCKCLALELAPHDILVNEIAPGYVNAGLSGRMWEKDPVLGEQAKNRVPIKKLISVEDVAEQMVYLCHPNNQHMTGATYLMDGGLSLL